MAALAVFLLHPRPAEACSPPVCWSGDFLPEDGATVPAEGGVFTWRPMFSHADSEAVGSAHDVRLLREDDPQKEIPLEVTDRDGTYLLEPAEPLEPGARYRLVDPAECEYSGESGPEVAFEADEAAPLPSELGKLAVTARGIGDLEVETPSGTCSASITADRVLVELEPSSEAKPWLDVFHFETLVDGEPWRPYRSINETHPPGSSWIGRGRDELYATCESDDDAAQPGLETGLHEVVLRATLPGTDVSLETAPVQVRLSCRGGLGGCAIRPGAHAPSGALLAGFALVLALGTGLRRRRKTRRGG